ncbi:MAG: glycosyltransferase family 4 protein [Candidatus Omnitrophica bacterium]|nr:glycosyltransferase family 4 protein [Candidatus Omnitrophota bacterium]
MNILFMTTHLNTGGITSYVLTVSKGLIARGHKVSLVSSGGELLHAFEQAGVKVFVLDIRTKSELSFKLYRNLSRVNQIIRERNIDCVHPQTRITQVMARFVSQRAKVPVVTTCHGYFTPRWSRRLCPCWGNRVIAISNAVVEHLRDDFKVNVKKIALIHNGIDLAPFREKDGQLRHRMRQQYQLSDELVLGIIARLSDVKGQDILIEAVSEVIKEEKRVKLFLFGEGKFESHLKALVSRYQLNNFVSFYSVTRSVLEQLSVIDIFIMPSRKEGLGLSVMEAQAAGKPVIVSNVGGLKDLVEDGVTGLFCQPLDPVDLSEKIIQLIRDPRLRIDLGRQAERKAMTQYSETVMMDKTVALYSELITQQSK